MPRRRVRSSDFEVRVRNMLEAQGLPALAGLSRLGTLADNVNLGGIAPSVIRDGSSAAGSAAGQLLVLSATGVSIASGGDYVTFDTQVYRHGFSDAEVTSGGTTVVWPTSFAGCSIQVELAWDTYQGGGKVEVEVDGAVPDWGLLADASSGQRGWKRRSGHIAAASDVKIKVTQTSGSAQTGDVYVEFVLPDPADGALVLLDTFWVDSKTSGGGTSAIELDAALTYDVRVTGNWRDVDPTYDEGNPDNILFPSPGESVELAGLDAETIYASDTAGTYPVHNGNSFQFDLGDGSGFQHVEPNDGPVSTPAADHEYRYRIDGNGTTLSAKVVDSTYTNNNGQLRVDIYRRV